MRINMHPNRRGVYPRWFEALINEYVEEFRKEYSVTSNEAYAYFF